jgi:hypothetical protein
MVWSGKASDGALPDLFSAHVMQPVSAMRDHDDERKKPRPVRSAKKGTNASEAAEALPWHLLKDADRDRHRHV